MPAYRTHPVSSLVSHLDRQSNGRGRPASAELSVGGRREPVEPTPEPDPSSQLAELAAKLEDEAETSGAATIRQADIAWSPMVAGLADQFPKSVGMLAALTHVLTVDDGAAMTIHLAGDSYETSTARNRFPELDALVSRIEPARPRHIRIHTAGQQGQSA